MDFFTSAIDVSLATKVNLDHFSALKLIHFLQIHLLLLVRKNQGLALTMDWYMSTGCDVGIMTNVCFLSQKIVRNEKRVKLTQHRTGQNNFIKITFRSYFPFSNTQVQETQRFHSSPKINSYYSLLHPPIIQILISTLLKTFADKIKRLVLYVLSPQPDLGNKSEKLRLFQKLSCEVLTL